MASLQDWRGSIGSQGLSQMLRGFVSRLSHLSSHSRKSSQYWRGSLPQRLSTQRPLGYWLTSSHVDWVTFSTLILRSGSVFWLVFWKLPWICAQRVYEKPHVWKVLQQLGRSCRCHTCCRSSWLVSRTQVAWRTWFQCLPIALSFSLVWFASLLLSFQCLV